MDRENAVKGGASRANTIALITGLLLVGLVFSAGVFWRVTAPLPSDVVDRQSRVDDASTDLAAAATDALAGRALAQDGPSIDDDAPPIHRRGGDTHHVAQIVDRETGLPVAGARVELYRRHLLRDVWHRETLFAREPVATAQAESDGSVWVPFTLRGIFHLDVNGPEHHATDFARLELSGAETIPKIVHATRGGRVRGRLVTRSLEPVAAARVLAMPAAPAMIDVMQGGHLTLRTARVSADGGYELSGVPVGTGWRIAAFDGTFIPTTSSAFTIRPGDEVAVDVIVGATRTLHGRVRNRSGQPVADAVVSYTAKPASGIDGYDLMTRYATPQRKTWTDAAGRFALTCVPGAEVQIWAVHEQYGASERRPLDLRSAHLADVHLVLDDRAAVRGMVTDATGGPIGDADITWLGPRSRKRPLTAEEQVTARSASDGSFALFCPGTDHAVEGSILVRCTGYARAIQPLTVPATRLLRIVLQAGRAIEGEVTSKATGEPIREFSVLVDLPKALRGLGRDARAEQALRFRSRTGQFRTEPEFGGEVEVTVESAGFDTMTIRVDLDNTGPGTSGDAALQFELEPALVLAGLVVDVADAPVHGAVVEAGDWSMVGIFSLDASTARVRAKTDAAGRFELPSVRPNKDKYVHVYHDDYLPLPNQRVRAKGGAFELQRFVVQRGGAIAGSVTTAGGFPCRAFEVVCLSIAGKGTLHRATTDAAGKYQIDRLDPERSYDLAVLPPGTPLEMRRLFAAVLESGVVVAAGGITRVDLTYAGTGNSTVRGLVSLADGTPLAGATVMLLDDSAGDAFGLRGSMRAKTGDDGRFEIDEVEAGQYVITFGEISAVDRNAARFGQKSIGVSAGENVELDLVIATGVLRGVIRDADSGVAVVGASVLLQTAAAHGSAPHNAMLLRLASRRTDDRGEFSFRSVAEGSYRLVILPRAGTPFAGASAGPYTIGPASTLVEVTVALPHGVLLRARVHDPSGPVVGARLVLNRPGRAGLVRPLVTGSNGEVETSAVSAGRYSAIVQHGDRTSAEQVVQVPSNGTVQLEFVLPR